MKVAKIVGETHRDGGTCYTAPEGICELNSRPPHFSIWRSKLTNKKLRSDPFTFLPCFFLSRVCVNQPEIIQQLKEEIERHYVRVLKAPFNLPPISIEKRMFFDTPELDISFSIFIDGVIKQTIKIGRAQNVRGYTMAEYMEYDWRSNVISKEIAKELAARYYSADPKNRNISIQALQSLIQTCSDYELRKCLPQDEKVLQKFLYARKFDIKESFDLLKNYYLYRKRNTEIFNNFSLEAEDIQKALENGLPGVLTSKDRKGRCVLVFTANNWDCSYSLVSIYRAFLFSLEHVMNEIHNQTNGVVVIVDWTEFPFRKSTNLKPSILKLMIEGLQDCFPVRFKGIHFIGQPCTLHELVHKDILPADLGGEQPSYNPRSFLDLLQTKFNTKATS
ncbi:hypothetical protein NQ317_015196 [Molorchus minor]|uniref:CRAL/TRIO N-terminal domain-containing protein n=1 Tax=Molorchus minor TaxID=1323400 RepID=A0ABQ9JPY4_9CUCU|nr:hypothetical protein NQ317_015196 [Molorchus minor]